MTLAPMKQELETLLKSSVPRGDMLKRLQQMAASPEFGRLANIWAPGLYELDLEFFQSFLLQHLRGSEHGLIIRTLIDRVEPTGQDELFSGLYRKVVLTEDQWNRDLTLVIQGRDDAQLLLKALNRRAAPEAFWLTERTALALYRKHASLYVNFLKAHLPVHWGDRGETFTHLLDAVQKRGDEELYWFIFRRVCSSKQWASELRKLVEARVPPFKVADELEKRHPQLSWRLDADVLASLVDAYGKAVVPYLERHLPSMRRRATPRLLAAIQKLGDEALYWKIFFMTGSPKAWNQGLRDLINQGPQLHALEQGVKMRTPPPLLMWWSLESDVAISLMKIDAARFRPFLERFITTPDIEVWKQAEKSADEDFLDWLAYRVLYTTFNLTARAWPQYGGSPDKAARAQLNDLAQQLCARWDRLRARSALDYVSHAARTLTCLGTHEVWSFKHQLTHNPALRYLWEKHSEAWFESAEAMLDLLESPNIHVQRLVLRLLGRQALTQPICQLVMQRLPDFRALLLSGNFKSTKRMALSVLQRLAVTDTERGRRVLAMLRTCMDFHSRHAIDEDIMVAVVRLENTLPAAAVQVGSEALTVQLR